MDLRRHVLDGAAHADLDAALAVAQLPGQAEVDDAEVEVVLLLAEDDVERLEVEVDEAARVDELDASADLPHDDPALVLRQLVVLGGGALAEVAAGQELRPPATDCTSIVDW